MIKNHFTLEMTSDNIAIVSFKNKNLEMNVLEKECLLELNDLLDDFSGNPEIKGVVITSGRMDQFIVGANISEIAAFKTAADATEGASKMQAVFHKIATLKCPTVAAIHGPCLGGGLELALACDWRIVTNAKITKLALPEIKLGLIPGAGGTQRLPKTIGIQAALDMIATGRNIAPLKAKKIGLADASVPEVLLLDQAIIYAKKKKNSISLHRNSSLSKDLSKLAIEGNPIGRKVMYRKAKDMIETKTKGFYPASYKALDAVFDGYDLPVAKGLKIEASYFGELAMTKESKSLIHLFNATNHIKKHPFKAATEEKFGKSKPSNVGIVGAGFMGAGIATVCADRGIHSKLSDPSKESISKALKLANTYFSKKVDRRKLKSFELPSKIAHISPALNPIGLHRTDITIEAVYENLELKQKILQDIESRAGNDWIFATNTSALPVEKIAEAAANPERVVGMHFFSPVEKMPLLEVIKTNQSEDWAVGRVVQLGQQMGKQVIIVNDGPGFYTTRALAFLLAEAILILKEGCEIKLIDKALTEFGFPVGPATLIDEVGIDVGLHVLQTMSSAFPDRISLDPKLHELVEKGILGRKSNEGLFKYENGKKGEPNENINKIFDINESKTKHKAHEIVDRVLLVFINESVRCLDDGILSHPHDGDVGAVFGLGFPPFWGGPFKYIDLVGAKSVVSALKSLEEKFGERFAPAKSLLEHSENGTKYFPDEYIETRF